MNENEMMQDDEISLFDLWERLRDGWRYVVGGTVLGLAGAGAALMILPPKYEAVAVVQVAQVGQITYAQLGQVMQIPSLNVEPATQAVERMKTPAFQTTVAKSLANQAWIDDLQQSANATARYLSLQLIKATSAQGASSLIEVKANGASPDEAKKIADASVNELSKRHSELAKPILEKMHSDLKIAKEKLVSAEKELEGINKLVASAAVKDDRFTQLSLMTGLRVQKESELFAQRQAIAALETALSAPSTQPTKAIEDIFVTDKPVSPKKSLLLALGLIGGLLAGVVMVFFVDAWRRARTQRLNSTSA
jgi:LPS O-antigen subunit length determinant protein (WzzB/FepE family)